jgi:hypothetical protein
MNAKRQRKNNNNNTNNNKIQAAAMELKERALLGADVSVEDWK